MLRVKEHPEELMMDAGVLFCKMCRHEVHEHKSRCDRHLASAKHVRYLAGCEARGKIDALRKLTISQHFEATNAKGSTLSEAHTLFRVNTLRTLLRAGIPLNKLDGPLRTALEHNNFSLTSASHMAELLPVVTKEEMSTLRGEVKDQLVSVIFDGTTDGAEVLGVVLR